MSRARSVSAKQPKAAKPPGAAERVTGSSRTHDLETDQPYDIWRRAAFHFLTDGDPAAYIERLGAA